jgi:RHS repeat-associated protein
LQVGCTPFVNGNPALGVAGSPGNFAAFQLNVDANVADNGEAWSSGGYVFYYENHQPWISYLDGLSNVWTSQAAYSGTIGASDTGAGMRSMRLKLDTKVKYDHPENWSCGDANNRCPLSIYGTYSFEVESDGPWDVQAEATDAVSNFRGDWQHTIRVDRTGPTVVFGAQLAAKKNRIVAEPTRVKIKATDGNAEYRGSQRSGVKRIQAWLDRSTSGNFDSFTSESIADTGNVACAATHSCELALPNDYIFQPGSRTLGMYRIRVEACDHTQTPDGKGNCTTDTLPFELGAGRALAVVDGQRTARYIPLQAVGERNQTGVEFKYRLPASSDQNLKSNWQPIPQNTVRVVKETCTLGEQNTPCQNIQWPVLLKTPPEGGSKINDQLAWDLTRMPEGSKIPDGPLEIVGVFTGGEGGKSDDVRMHYSQDGINSPNGTTDFGPGKVDVVSGNLSIDETDVSVPAFKGDLTVGRTYNSRKWRRASQEASIFGDGWTASLPGLESAPEFVSVSYEPPTTTWEEDDEGDLQAYVEPGFAIVNGASGTEFAFEEDATNRDEVPGDPSTKGKFTPERDAEHLILTRDGPLADPTGFTVVDTETDVEMTFAKSGSSTVYELRTVVERGSSAPAGTYKATYHWGRAIDGATSGPFRLKRMTAPKAPGMTQSCDVAPPSNPPAGCRWLDFVYGQSGNAADRLIRVDFSAYLPSTGKVTTQMAEYTYRSGGLLEEAIDKRAGTKTVYEYGAHNLLTTITPMRLAASTSGGDRPWTFTYARQDIDADNGRVETVKREVPTHEGPDEDALTQLRWFISREPGDGRPDMTPATLEAKFDQRDLPIEGTMVVPPDAQPYEFGKSVIHYYNAAGRTVNVAQPGNRVSTTEHDAHGNVVRSLSPANREEALRQSGDAAIRDKALRLSSIARWCTTGAGSRVEREWSPERKVKLPDGSTPDNVRTYTKYTYGRYPGGCPAYAGIADEAQAKNYQLITEQRTSALKTATDVANGGTRFRADTIEPNDREVTVAGESNATESDLRITETTYDNTLLLPTKVTVDPGAGGLNLETVTEYDQATGLVTQERTPRSATTSGHAGTRVTEYYTASGSGACVQAEYATWPCKVKQAGEPMDGTQASPAPKQLETRIAAYNEFGQPLRIREYASPDPDSDGGATRLTKITYTQDGQVAEREVTTPTSRATGTPVPKQTNTFHPNGRPHETKVTDGGSERVITRVYDEIGRVKEYTDAGEYTTGATSNRITTSTRFDLLGRVKETWSSDRGTGSADELKRKATYSEVTGDLVSVADPDLGTVTADGPGDYDADGRLLKQTYTSSGVVVTTGFDSNGEPIGRAYAKGGTVWHRSDALPTAHGQVAELSGATAQDKQIYDYDKAGRLTQASDTTQGQCTIRQYEFHPSSNGAAGLNSNRTKLTTKAPGSGGACNPGASGSTVEYTYDTADRLLSTKRGSTTGPAFEYDILGRTTRVPAADAGGKTLDATYYENDLAHTLTQDQKTTTNLLDPAQRVRSRTTTGTANPELLHYADDTDEPLLTKTGGVATREIEGLDGDLAATRTDGAPAATIKISNVHGDVVGEAPNTSNSTGPGASVWPTDEFGVPRQTGSSGGTPATITKVGPSTKAARTTNGTTLAIDKPTGTQTGDLLLAGLTVNAGSSITAPSGWAAVSGSEVVSGTSKWQLFYKYAGASEGSSYTFSMGSSNKHAGGITALRNTATSDPVNAIATGTGFGTNVTAPSVTPTEDGSAIELLFGSNTGDNNGGEAWTVTSPLSLDWTASTGASASGNRNAGMALRILTGGKNTPTGTFTITNATGNSSNVSNAAITAAITPAGLSGPSYQQLPKHAYLGAKQRNTTLPTGIIEMGARLYVPQIGRFLQVDPVYGGSANDYDYAWQDPVNKLDLDGRQSRGGPGAPRITPRGQVRARAEARRASGLSNYKRGMAAERRVSRYYLGGLRKNTQRISEVCERVKYRVPDFMTYNRLYEVKYVRRLNYSSQMDDYLKYARNNGMQVTYFVKKGAPLSKRVARAFDEYNVQLIRID